MNPSPAKILVIEDEKHLAEGIRENLQAEGYLAEVALDGPNGSQRIRDGDYDLVILDVMLPGIDGFSLCETIRAQGIQTPILFLTARASVDDRIRGLEAGGDDYLHKPFHLKELLLRVRAILRRTSWYQKLSAAGSTVSFGGNEFDLRRFQGHSWDGREQTLTLKEAMILKVLAEHEGEVVSREEILEKVWGYDLFPSTRTIDNFIVRLRKRFERDPEKPEHLHTVWGIGYRFTRQPEV
ncbi:MAG TPA: response regulator transcription factor [Acidobacteriota bacterium]